MWKFRLPPKPIVSDMKDWEVCVRNVIHPVFPAYHAERMLLPEVGDKVPKTVDWRNVKLAEPVCEKSQIEGWAASLFYNLKCFGTLIEKKFVLTYPELEEKVSGYKDIVDDRKRAELGLRYAMKKGAFEPRHTMDLCRPPRDDNLVPLNGYIRFTQLKEQFLLRAIAQQPVMVGIRATPDFVFKEGIYKPKPCGQITTYKDHLVTAVGYDDNYILLQNTNPSIWWANPTGFKIERGVGVEGILTYGIIPVMDRSMTKFNYKLVQTNMVSLYGDMFSYLKQDSSIIEIPE